MERGNPMKKHSKALVFFAVSKQIPIVYSADRGRAEKIALCLLWLSLPGYYRVTDEALLADT